MHADVCIPLNSMVIEIEEEVSWGFGGGGGVVLSGLFGGILGGNGRGMHDEVGFVGLSEA